MTDDSKKRGNLTLAIRGLGYAKAFGSPYSQQLYNVGLEKSRIELENCKGTTKEGMEKQVNEQVHRPAAGNRNDPATEAG